MTSRDEAKRGEQPLVPPHPRSVYVLVLLLFLLLVTYLPSANFLPAPAKASAVVLAVVTAPADLSATAPNVAAAFAAAASAAGLERAPRAHPLSTLYSCPAGTGFDCEGTSNSDLVDAVYDHIARQMANRSTWGGDACQWRASSPSHFTATWPHGVGPAAAAAAAQSEAPAEAAICLPLGVPHTLRLQARDKDGQEVCAGGDYLEARVEGPSVRARPMTKDFGDGTYSLTIHLPDDDLLVGPATLSVGHLFTGLAGLAWNHHWEVGASRTAQALPPTRLRLVRWGSPGCPGFDAAGAEKPASYLPAPTASCRTLDFTSQAFWRGHWVQQPHTGEGAQACRGGACTGDPSRALTLPWVYRLPYCHFHLFSLAEARSCLNNSWLFGSGDSTMLDTLGNLMVSGLALPTEGWVDMPNALPRGRHFDAPGEYTGWNASLGQSSSPPEAYWRTDSGPFFGRFSNIWNAAVATSGALHEQCCQGLTVVHNDGWKGRHRALLGPWAPSGMGPDVMLINTGMHDGMRFSLDFLSFRDYGMYVTESAPEWWRELRGIAMPSAPERSSACLPRMVWRHTYAPAGSHRSKRSNPQHMEVFNRMVAMTIFKSEGERAGGGQAAAVGHREPPQLPPRPPPARARGDNSGKCGRPQHSAERTWDFIDGFDISFPWHFDDEVSDGGHYGRHHGPGTDNVDRVTIQTLLNGLCPLL